MIPELFLIGAGYAAAVLVAVDSSIVASHLAAQNDRPKETEMEEEVYVEDKGTFGSPENQTNQSKSQYSQAGIGFPDQVAML
mmetsp:Transcript_7841/g.17906  ORF Transcript_7841/g.17906 Transcript_7841/m.17906 type:complete len:82 (-) Transcript_7841:150-395(-)|eukprot:767342-Hanusia_phi.AAC.3